VTTVVDGIYDLGSGALAVVRTTLVDHGTDRVLAECTSGLFVRGEGGFGGPRPAGAAWAAPDRPAELTTSATVRHDQALLYRLSGDVNPLHSDPAFAAAAGFDRPILHGLCTYGITARLLINALAGGDADRLTSIAARFTKPVLPGDTLTVQAWRVEDAVLFQTRDGAGDVVLDRGRCTIA
jgi:acyl dehydratase